MDHIRDFKLLYKSTNLPFQENGQIITASKQATRILQKAVELLMLAACSGIAIAYSANYDQTIALNNCYSQGNWKTNINGANQVAVMHEMELLLAGNYNYLCNKLRIASITTMSYSEFGNKSHIEIIKNDLNNINELLERGWCVLGWKNHPP